MGPDEENLHAQPTNGLAAEPLEEIESARRVFRELDKAGRASRTYGMANAATQRFIENLRGELDAHLSRWPVLAAVVERTLLKVGKPGNFTGDEWDLMRTHPSEGVLKLLSSRGIGKVPLRMAAAAFEHHLNLDLSGYPKLKTPWRMTLSSRVIAIADCYDAMTSARVYRREPLSPPAVLQFMLERSGKAFDAVLLKYFVTCVGIVPLGTLVLLDTAELAVVVQPAAAKEDSARPVVRVICDASGAPLEPPVDVDLRDKDLTGRHLRSIVRLVDNTEYRLETSRYLA